MTSTPAGPRAGAVILEAGAPTHLVRAHNAYTVIGSAEAAWSPPEMVQARASLLVQALAHAGCLTGGTWARGRYFEASPKRPPVSDPYIVGLEQFGDRYSGFIFNTLANRTCWESQLVADRIEAITLALEHKRLVLDSPFPEPSA